MQTKLLNIMNITDNKGILTQNNNNNNKIINNNSNNL